MNNEHRFKHAVSADLDGYVGWCDESSKATAGVDCNKQYSFMKAAKAGAAPEFWLCGDGKDGKCEAIKKCKVKWHSDMGKVKECKGTMLKGKCLGGGGAVDTHRQGLSPRRK